MNSQVLDQQVIEAPYEIIQLGTIETTGPQDVINRGVELADRLADIVNKRKLYVPISGRKYVKVEGWTALGALIGILPREVEGLTRELDTGDYEATVELIRATDGAIVGRASSTCGTDEPRWADKPRYARRSMAVTRATGKAYRLGFSWIMALAGYEPTPFEEMPDEPTGQVSNNGKPAKIDIMTIEQAGRVLNSKGTPYIDITSERLSWMSKSIDKAISNNGHDQERLEQLRSKRSAIKVILQARAEGAIDEP